MPPAAHKRTTEEKCLASSSAPFFEVPATNVGQVRLLSYEASGRGTSLHGEMFHKNIGGARTRSLSPGQRRHAIASIVNSMDDLKSLSQPLSASTLPQLMLRPPAHIGSCPIPSAQWKKGKLLGSGTFGQVYYGFNSESGRICAIKEVKVILDDPKSKERLRQLNQEVEILTQLSHPNIVQYYGSELNDESLSIYLEYVSGGSIHQLLRNYGPFNEPVIRNYTRVILSGLAYLHGMKTTHSDIKGANVLVDQNGEAKLADFGMVKHITSLAEMHFFKESMYWMAPEVINNKNGYSLEADIWSLGCTIIEMGTGKHPWHAHEDVAALFNIANSNQIPEIPESFSKEGKDFLSMCLKRDPTQRPSATWLLGHPFVQDHQATRQTQCNTTLRNKLSSPAKSNQEPLSKRNVAPLLDIGVIGF